MQTQKGPGFSPREAIERALKSRHPATVQQLAEIVVAESVLSEEDVVQIVKEMTSSIHGHLIDSGDREGIAPCAVGEHPGLIVDRAGPSASQ